MAKYDNQHREIPDKTPVEMPIGYEIPESLESMIARMIKSTNAMADKAGKFDTLEEADDFEDDETEMVSPYQMTDMQEETPYARTQPKDAPSTSKSAGKAQAEPETVKNAQPVEKTKEMAGTPA